MPFDIARIGAATGYASSRRLVYSEGVSTRSARE